MPFIVWMKAGNISHMKNWDIAELNNKNIETMQWEFHHLKEKDIFEKNSI